MTDDTDKKGRCLPSCFNTSLVFDSLGEDMIVVVMKDEEEAAATDDVEVSAGKCDRLAGQFWGRMCLSRLQLSD